MKNLTVNEFVNWLNEKRVIFAQTSGKVNKAVGYDLKGFIFVAHNDRIVLTTKSPQKAIDLYNQIDENSVFE